MEPSQPPPEPTIDTGDAMGIDGHILGQILAAQNILFALPNYTRIAEFFAQALISLPGVSSCRLCLGNVSVQVGDPVYTPCLKCEDIRKSTEETATISPEIVCELVGRPNFYSHVISSNEHQFGFFTFRVTDSTAFDPYWPFVSNLANYVALSLENRLRKDLLQNAHDELENRVKERTQELVIANVQLQKEIEINQRVEETLRRERTLSSRIMETSPVGITMVNREGHIIFANPQAEKVLGLTKDEITHRTYNAPSWHITTNNGEPFPNEELPFQQVMSTGQAVYDVQHMIAWPDGHRLALSINGAPILNDAGDVESVVFTIEDITERKRAEQTLRDSETRFRAVFEGSVDAIGVSKVGIHVFVNPSYLALFAYTDETELSGKPILDLIAPSHREQVLENVRLRTGGQAAPAVYETRGLRKDGSEFDMEVHTSTYKLSGEVYTIAILRNITERKQMEAALQEREKHSQSLLRLSQRLEQAQTYSDILNAAQDEVRTIIGYQNLWAYLFTPDKKQATALFAKGPMSEKVMTGEGIATLTIEGDQMLEEIVEAKGIVVVEDAQTDERTNKEIVAWLGNRTIVNVPIILSGQHLGSVGTGTFGDEGVRVPSETEQGYLSALASHMAVTLDRIHLLNERKQAEAALRAANAYNRSLIEASLDPLVTISPEGKITDVNQATEVITGVPREHLIGDDFTNYFTEPQKARDGYQTVLAEGMVRDYPLTVRHTSGKNTEVLYNATVYKDDAGEIQGVFAAARDITKRKQAEDELRASEEKFRTIIEQSSEGVALIDESGLIVEWNKTNEQMTGLTREEVVGLPLWDMAMMTIAPERRTTQYHESFKMAVQEALQTGESYLFAKPVEAEFYPRSGNGKGYLHQTIFPIKTEKGYRIASLTHDITDRKRAESEIQALAKFPGENPNPVLRAGRDGILLYANQASADVLQCWNCYVGKQLPDFWHKLVLETLNSGALREIEAACGERLFVMTLAPIADVHYVNFYGRDITERKQAERKVNELAAIVQSSEDAIIGKTLDGIITSWNRGAEKIYGFTEGEVIGKSISIVIPPERYDEFTLIMNKIRAGEHIEHYETMRRRKDGNLIYVSLAVSPILNSEGKVIAASTIGRDITERKLSEEALQESEMKYRIVADNTYDWEFWLDPDDHFIYSSPSSKRVTGYSPDNFENDPELFQRIVHPDDRHHFIAHLHGKETAKLAQLEMRILHHNGDTRWIAHLCQPVFDSSGKYLGIRGSNRDITERKQAEDALQEKHKQLIEAQHIAHLGNWWHDLVTNELYWSDEFFKILGCDPQKPTVELGLAWIHPDDLHILQSAMEESAAGKVEHNHEFRIIRPDGEIRWIHNRWVGVYDENGREIKRVGTHQDITERKLVEERIARSLAAEKKAREFAEILRDANESLSRTLNLEDVLQNLLKYLGRLVPYDSANVMLLEDNYQLHVAALSGYETWTDVNNTRKIIFDVRTTPVLNELVIMQKTMLIADTREHPGWIRPAGAEHVINWLGVPIIAGRQVIGLYSVDKAEPRSFTDEHCRLAEGLAGQAAVAIQNARLHDQIKRANVDLEQRVMDRTAQLEAANKELEAFAYSVSHDLRAPLRHIDGFIELLEKKTKTSLDQQSQRYMDIIADSAKHMGTLIDDLLSFSRMGRNEMYMSEVDLGELIQEVIQEFKPDIEGRNIDWQVAALPPIIGDRSMLRMVLVNLISNAIKFTISREHPKIEIGSLQENPTETVFFIRDNGVGFDMEYAGKLFGVFQRLHRQEDFEGTGIGLANVRRIINRHDGRVWAEGKVDHGATFFFSLPKPTQEST